jgi:hypothetical protein
LARLPNAFPIGTLPEQRISGLAALIAAYRLRVRRRILLIRALRRRHELTAVANLTDRIVAGDILCMMTIRNESQRLPFVLDHHRKLGVRQFLIVDNDSTDGSHQFLVDQPDVSLWHTASSYKASRFGMDWLTWLMLRYGHGHWTCWREPVPGVPWVRWWVGR